MRILCIAAICFTFSCSAVAQSIDPAKAAPSDASQQSASQARADSTQRQLRDDLAKMRLLLHQMQTNLAFAQVGDTPMKHQFELEIDMWTVLINHMESELRQTQAPAPPPHQ